MFLLRGTSGTTDSKLGKEAPMRKSRVVVSAIAETAWTLGAGVAAGLLLLP